jgi:hypothetical protein
MVREDQGWSGRIGDIQGGSGMVREDRGYSGRIKVCSERTVTGLGSGRVILALSNQIFKKGHMDLIIIYSGLLYQAKSLSKIRLPWAGGIARPLLPADDLPCLKSAYPVDDTVYKGDYLR